jgi:hypothetical protein
MVLFVRADVRHGMRCCLHFSFLMSVLMREDISRLLMPEIKGAK